MIKMFLFTLYQKIISPAYKQLFGIQSMCRFSPSCSEYMKRSIQKYGILKGGWFGLVRLGHCQPLFKNFQFSNLKFQTLFL